jgi:hypothetical protein
VLTKSPALSVEETKTLVAERKWLDALQAAVQGEVDQLSQQLAGRLKGLSERYVEPLPELMQKVERLTTTGEGGTEASIKGSYSIKKHLTRDQNLIIIETVRV